MRKMFLFVMLFMFGALAAGCSNDGPITLQDDQGQGVKIENLGKPALVFFFTGIG